MHIDSIEIKGFGKLKNRVLSFGKGMNVVFGANEAGKSTMQSFIRAMFYGLKGGKRSVSGLPSPQKRFMPWDGEPYGGAVAYTLDAGASYRIERDFSRNSVVVYDTAYNDITSSFNFSRDRQPMVGETHLGLDEVTFENTVFIRQMGVRLDSTGSSVLAARLVNVDDPDIDGLAFQRAEAALTDALKNRVGTERSRVQPLDRLQSELRRLESEHGTLAGRQKEKEKLMRELSEIKDRIRHFETQEQLLVKIGELIETRKKIDEGMKREARYKSAAQIEIILRSFIRYARGSYPTAGTRQCRSGPNPAGKVDTGPASVGKADAGQDCPQDFPAGIMCCCGAYIRGAFACSCREHIRHGPDTAVCLCCCDARMCFDCCEADQGHAG